MDEPTKKLDYATPRPATPANPWRRLTGALACAAVLNVLTLGFCIGFRDGGIIAGRALAAAAVFWAFVALYLTFCRLRPSMVGAMVIAYAFPFLAWLVVRVIAWRLG